MIIQGMYQIPDQIPDQLKTIDSLAAFKNQVKKVNFDNCPCNLCKEYIQGVGYIT